MHLEQGRETKFVAQCEHLADLVICEAFRDEQDRVGAMGTGFVDLVWIDHEVLAEDREIDFVLDEAQESQVPAEELFVCEAGNGRCACLGVLLRDDCRIKPILVLLSADEPSAWAAPFDLRNDSHGWMPWVVDNRREEIARWFSVRSSGLKFIEWDRRSLGIHLLTLVGNDLGEDRWDFFGILHLVHYCGRIGRRCTRSDGAGRGFCTSPGEECRGSR